VWRRRERGRQNSNSGGSVWWPNLFCSRRFSSTLLVVLPACTDTDSGSLGAPPWLVSTTSTFKRLAVILARLCLFVELTVWSRQRSDASDAPSLLGVLPLGVEVSLRPIPHRLDQLPLHP
jgi:hypothetical protein